ncbi:MAG TPA: protein-disulfide reductase DsbD domain-containing protein, partial [Bryobacteraceae bacterium]|nr:protein-disulfide reductase DsbD domain-containing protein [Bryobacteraceae bacterium]
MRTGRAFLVFALVLLASGCLQAKEDPVQWAIQPVKGFEQVKPGAPAWLELTATVQPGWHLYSPTTPPGGPIPTKIELTPNPAVIGAKVWRQNPVRRLDPNFNIDTETYAGSAIFYIEADT